MRGAGEAEPDRVSSGSRSSRLRVCIVAPSLDILGGQAVVAQRLMDQLESDPDIELSFLPHNPRLPGVLRHLQRVKYLRTIVTSAAYVVLLLRRLPRQDVVHVFSASYWSFLLAPTPAVLIGKAYGKRVVLNYRSGEAADHLTRWRRTAIPILRRADLIVTPSGYLVDVFAKFGLVARSIFNFVDLSKIRYRERSTLRPVFLTNRNFAPHYNVACVLRAFQLVQQAMPEARLIVAGDGEQRQMLEDLAHELGLRNTEFVGQVTPARMAELYDGADVYLNAPNIDNMPNSVIESFAAGLPVVTTSAGGIPYIVTDGETGLMVAPDDHVALAREAKRLFSEPGLGNRLARRAREEVLLKYTWPAVHDAWRDAYGLPPVVR
jgi:L-malate glycosyltransferase